MGDRSEVASEHRLVNVGDWVVSSGTCTIARSRCELGGEPAAETVKITPRSMDVLRLLIDRAGSVVSSTELLETFWRSPIATDHAVHKAIAELRSALQDNAHQPTYIRTIPKRGYTLIAPVSQQLPGNTPAVPPASAGDSHIQPPSLTPGASMAAANAALDNGSVILSDQSDQAGPESVTKPSAASAGRWKRWSLVAALVATVAASPLLLHRNEVTPEAGEMTSLVVLPFTSRDFSDQNQSIADGIREALIHGLASLNHLHVISPPRYLEQAAAPDTSALALAHAGHVLEGSVTVSDGRLRVIVHLIRAHDGLREYSDQFDLPMSDIFAVQDEITNNVVRALSVYLNEQERAQMQDWGTTSPLAYEQFLHGEFYNNQFNSVDWGRAMAHHRAAIELDPNFLNAYHGLATAANNRAVYSGSIDTITDMSQVVMDVHREMSRIAPDSDILDSLHAIKLRLRGSSYIQQETQMREQILSGDPPSFVMAHYALLLIGARMYDEAIRFLDRTAETGPHEISPDEAWSYRLNVLTPRNSVTAHKNQLQQRPFHMSFLGSVAINLALLGDFRQAHLYLNQQREVDVDGVPSHYTETIIDFLSGRIRHGDASYEQALRDHPDFYYNNGVLAFMAGDIDAGVRYWQGLHPTQLRRLFNVTHSAEKYFPPAVLNSPAYHDLLESLGAGISWQRRLMEGVMAMEHVTGVGLHPDSLKAYHNGEFMLRNNAWSERDWAELDQLHSLRRNQPQSASAPRIH